MGKTNRRKLTPPERLRRLMGSQGYTQEALALAITERGRRRGVAVSRVKVGRWLRGETVPSAFEGYVMAEVLGVDFEALADPAPRRLATAGA